MRENLFYILWVVALLLWAAGFMFHLPDLTAVVGIAALWILIFLRVRYDQLEKQYFDLSIRSKG